MSETMRVKLCTCRTPLEVEETYGGQWVAVCRHCYDGTEDAPDVQHVVGEGRSYAAAVTDWHEKLELALDR
jgi:hypothetical protein